MTRQLQAVLAGALGSMALWLVASGGFQDYVKPTLAAPLVLAGGFFVALGLTTLVDRDAVQLDRESVDETHHEHHSFRVPWLLLLPILAVVLVAPGSLGSYAAARDGGRTIVSPGEGAFTPLPAPVQGVVDVTLSDFARRSQFDTADTLAVASLRLVGFVVADPSDPDQFLLTRFRLYCCAADASPVQVTVVEYPGPIPPEDTWVEIVGTWVRPSDDLHGDRRGITLRVEQAKLIDEPSDPYEW